MGQLPSTTYLSLNCPACLFLAINDVGFPNHNITPDASAIFNKRNLHI